MPTAIWGTLRVCASKNVKDCVDALVLDLSNTGISLHWKEHQSAESSSQVLLIYFLSVFDREGIEEEVRYRLKEIKIWLCTKGKLDTTLLTIPLPDLVITWHQNKQGKG